MRRRACAPFNPPRRALSRFAGAIRIGQSRARNRVGGGEPMSKLTRRSFLAAAGAAAASPAFGATQQKSKALPGEPRSAVDIVIIGAGAAGIAAARRIIASGRKCVVLE